MALTPETLVRHELIGLGARVAAADDRGRVGTAGRVVGETERTLRIETRSREDGGESRTEQVPKAGATFEFALAGERVAPTDLAPAGPAAGDGAATAAGSAGDAATESEDGDEATYVTIEGERLAGNPARRTERRGDSKWR
jgi:ribonuclease P protein subunit POP4